MLEDIALLLGLRLQDAEGKVLLLQAADARNIKLLSHVREVIQLRDSSSASVARTFEGPVRPVLTPSGKINPPTPLPSPPRVVVELG